MKKKRTDLTVTEIKSTCKFKVCSNCSIRFEDSYCMGINSVNMFPDPWLEEEVEVEE